ncbi:hypothetical protein B0H13DRAFT_2341951 [Mycena leptocephala]|nr:hypothetical protein B0H13DRAFT_2341951 [Mycena leptocephala]
MFLLCNASLSILEFMPVSTLVILATTCAFFGRFSPKAEEQVDGTTSSKSRATQQEEGCRRAGFKLFDFILIIRYSGNVVVRPLSCLGFHAVAFCASASAHPARSLWKRNGVSVLWWISAPPCSSLLRVHLPRRISYAVRVRLQVLPASQPSSVSVLVRNTETDRILVDSDFSSNVRCMQWATSAVVLHPLPHVDSAVSCSVSIQDCTRSGSGSHDRAVGRKETSGQWHRPLFISAVALRPPSSARIPPFCHFFPPPCPSSSDPFSSPGYFPSFFYPPHGPRLPAPLSPCFVSRSAPPAPPLTAVVLLHASRSKVFSVSPALSQIRAHSVLYTCVDGLPPLGAPTFCP